MDKDLNTLFEETKETGTKVMKDLDRGISVASISIVLHLTAILGMLCLVFLDMTPGLRIVWEVILFMYFGILLIEAIINLVKVLKTKRSVKTTTQAVEIMHNIISGKTDILKEAETNDR